MTPYLKFLFEEMLGSKTNEEFRERKKEYLLRKHEHDLERKKIEMQAMGHNAVGGGLIAIAGTIWGIFS